MIVAKRAGLCQNTNTMDQVKCPHCHNIFELSEAIIHQLSEKAREKERKSLKIEFELKNKNQVREIEGAKKREKELLEKLAKDKEERESAEKKIKQDAKEEASKEIAEKHRFEKLEWEKQRSDMQKALEEAQRKGKQGSQQLQGDVLERDLEERLKEAFPYDQFMPVPTGIRGGDIVHEIRNKYGNVAGTILWEAKRTKSWDKTWTTKLKEDMRKINASDCILVSDILPPTIKFYDRVDNVWVTTPEYIINLASVLREGIMKVAIAKKSASHSDEQLRELYRIITSDSFRNKFEARDEIILTMKKELDSEKKSTEKRWQRQEVYIDKLARNNNQLYGELQAHIPSLKPLNSEELELEIKTEALPSGD